MEIEALIIKMKDIHTALLNFIESTCDLDFEFQTLTNIFKEKIFYKIKKKFA